jgi:hypothetical protein
MLQGRSGLTGNNFELSIDIHRGHSETGRERTQCFRKVLTNRLVST